jgi:hypothetical protein
MNVELIYIGHKFYRESKTMMSNIYSTSGERYDWGVIQRDLDRGKCVHIRPASKIEMNYYKHLLEEYKK